MSNVAFDICDKGGPLLEAFEKHALVLMSPQMFEKVCAYLRMHIQLYGASTEAKIEYTCEPIVRTTCKDGKSEKVIIKGHTRYQMTCDS